MPRISSWDMQCQVQRDAAFASDAGYAASLVAGRRRGAYSLDKMFAAARKHLDASEQRQQVERFCQSRWFAEYGECPSHDQQILLEEAFYRFLCDENAGDPQRRHAEFLDAVIRAIAVQPRPAFQIPAEIHEHGGLHYALTQIAGRHYLFAHIAGRVIRGPVSRAQYEYVEKRGCRQSKSPISERDWAEAGKSLAALGVSFDDEPKSSGVKHQKTAPQARNANACAASVSKSGVKLI